MEGRQIVNIKVSRLNYRATLSGIIHPPKLRTPSHVCFANVHMLIERYWSRSFAQLVNHATTVAADGMPVAKAFRWLYGINQE
jgi:N-acetylglucosaminyldiphosphoundecaprenol N-acetyl-beta-D-mannosaminyltransferase